MSVPLFFQYSEKPNLGCIYTLYVCSVRLYNSLEPGSWKAGGDVGEGGVVEHVVVVVGGERQYVA